MYLYSPQTKLREGNVFTGVCQSVHGGGEYGAFPPYPRDRIPLGTAPPSAGLHHPGRYPPQQQKRAVRILLECFLVLLFVSGTCTLAIGRFVTLTDALFGSWDVLWTNHWRARQWCCTLIGAAVATMGALCRNQYASECDWTAPPRQTNSLQILWNINSQSECV